MFCLISSRFGAIFRIMWLMTLITSVTVVVVASSETRGQTSAARDEAVVVPNAVCPVTTDEAIDPDQWVEYEGKRVYFCCLRCKRKFEGDPQAYLENLPKDYFAVAANDESETASAVIPASSELMAGLASVGDSHELAGSTDSPSHHGESGGAEGVGEYGGAEEEAGHDHAEGSGVSMTPPAMSQGTDEGDHDHGSHDEVESPGFFVHLIGWLGKFHPPSVHFPVALMVAALVAELLFMVTGRAMFDAASRFTVCFAIIGTIGAVILGWFFGGFKFVDGDWIMTTHRWVGTVAGVWAFVLGGLACRVWLGSQEGVSLWRGRYRLALFIGVVLVNVNGFLGGALIYGIEHYAW